MPHVPLAPRSPAKPIFSAMRGTTVSEWCVLRLSMTRCQQSRERRGSAQTATAGRRRSPPRCGWRRPVRTSPRRRCARRRRGRGCRGGCTRARGARCALEPAGGLGPCAQGLECRSSRRARWSRCRPRHAAAPSDPRRRQYCTVERATSSRRALSRTCFPAATARTICARTATCWGQLRRRTNDSSCARPRALTNMGPASSLGMGVDLCSYEKASGYAILLSNGFSIFTVQH